ncbi:hypothetical protein [Paenibacillus sp. R14(2021)]|uniref:hypothetical protein n=1 Tax=Paenibacillus sp. R14(2021) TaxID=2859228 RepID=UPI001C616AC4|nr:hypothetical protein [Paenibacillus sp. R14(2021)]
MDKISKKKKRWQAGAAAVALMVGSTLVFATSAAASTTTFWQLLNDNGSARTSEGAAAAYNQASNVDATVYVWRGATNNNIYFQSGYGDGRNGTPEAFPNTSSVNEPSITAVRDGWMILHRGSDNRIYYTTNAGHGGSHSISSFPVWQAIQVNGQFETTNDTPSVTATPDGNVTVAYRGTDSNLYSVEGHFDSAGVVAWNSNRALYRSPGVRQSTAWGPAVVSLANGHQYMFGNLQDAGHEPFYMTRSSAYTDWEVAPRAIPGTIAGSLQYTVGRATAAIGNTFEVGYLQADYNGQRIPTSAEGYNVMRTGYDAARGWVGYWTPDEQGWRTNASFSIDLLDEGHRVRYGELLHSANLATIDRLYVAYKDIQNLGR